MTNKAQTRAEQIVAMLNEGGAPTATPVAVTTRQRFGVRAKQVLIMRFMHDMTLEQVGQALGITRERVRQIESKALRMIRAKSDLRAKIADTLAELDAR